MSYFFSDMNISKNVYKLLHGQYLATNIIDSTVS